MVWAAETATGCFTEQFLLLTKMGWGFAMLIDILRVKEYKPDERKRVSG
jgi:hypothetical protein